jgi:hypothetical protein
VFEVNHIVPFAKKKLKAFDKSWRKNYAICVRLGIYVRWCYNDLRGFIN